MKSMFEILGLRNYVLHGIQNVLLAIRIGTIMVMSYLYILYMIIYIIYSIILYVHVILYMRLQNIFCLLEICDSERNEENVEVSIQSVTLFS